MIVKIIDITYDKDNNLFQMKVKDTKSDFYITLAISGKDWGISSPTLLSSNLLDGDIEKFCKTMIGKEKNLSIQEDQYSISSISKEKNKIEQEEKDKIYSNIDNYPIQEIINNQLKNEN